MKPKQPSQAKPSPIQTTKTKPQPLTEREKKVIKGKLAGKSLARAARDAGYTGNYPAQAANQALKNAKEKIPDLFERHGLDDDSFMRDHVLARLNAVQVKAQLHEGKWKYSRPLEDNSIRMQATRLVAEMKGLVMKEQDTNAAQIRVVVINQAFRPRRAPQVPIPQVPGLQAPKVIDAQA